MKKQIKDTVRAFRWKMGARPELRVLDQLLLPQRERWIVCTTHRQVARCIKEMNLRGAPAIGCAAAYGLALVPTERKYGSIPALQAALQQAAKLLASTRPTAINLFWAIDRMKRAMQVERGAASPAEQIRKLTARLCEEAQRIYQEDLAANYQIGALGAQLIPENSVVLTHCNAGSLATSGWGTALGVIRSAYQAGKVKKVLVDETRPYLQGARLTAWELKKDGIPFELITDNMAAHFMKTEQVAAVVVGSDRISAQGDVANKIGTYGLAVLCRHHRIPFYAAAPLSTIDMDMMDGSRIPIEERSAKEVTWIRGNCIAPSGVTARHPAFDVTPQELVSAIITEKGVARPPYARSIAAFFDVAAPEPQPAILR